MEETRGCRILPSDIGLGDTVNARQRNLRRDVESDHEELEQAFASIETRARQEEVMVSCQSLLNIWA